MRGSGVTKSRRTAEAELAALYAGYSRHLTRLLLPVCRNREDAEEVMQEAFVQLLRHWKRVRDYDDPRLWLRKVAINLAISRQRRAATAARLLPAWHQVRAQHAEANDQRPALLDSVLGLPLGQRVVIVLFYYEDLDLAAIAEILSLPVGTVKSRLARARAALAPLLAEEYLP